MKFMHHWHKLRKGIHRRGLHIVAIFEAVKGTLALAASLGLLHYIHHDLQKLGEHLVLHFGMNPHGKYSEALMKLLSGITDHEIIVLSLLALLYSTIRFLEAYGLWKEKTWGQWLAIISGGLYLPFELIAIYNHFTWTKVMVTFFNILLLIYLIWVKFSDERAESDKSSDAGSVLRTD